MSKRNRTIFIAPFLAATLSLSSVSQAQSENPTEASALSTSEDGPQESHIPADVGEDGKKITNGMTAFGADIYKTISGTNGDLAISPASISAAFALAYAGANGPTAQDIASTLHYPTNLHDFHGSFGKLQNSMQIRAKGRDMAVNNAIWLQKDLPVHDSYLALVDRHYGAGLRLTDFKKDPDAARVQINMWVESKTNDRIRDLLNSSNVTDTTKSILINTIYFKADWANPFSKKATKAGAFKTLSGSKKHLSLMQQRENFHYRKRNGTQFLAMPYRGGEIEMVFILPQNSKKFHEIEQSLSKDTINQWIRELQFSNWSDVTVTIPKFKIEKRYELRKNLETLGMKIPFSNSSDFSKMKPVDMSTADPNDWNLKIKNVIHKVFVEVEEKGTEAAAATAITAVIVTSAGPTKPLPQKTFRADHPFLFLIRDRRTDAILFIGRFTGDDTETQ